tara:strand:+ start:16016 stop:19726 length:3711 start_codon:yes stop_codon:yes gene_type:complete
MNQDSDPRFLKEGEYIEARNLYISSNDNGNDGAAENIKDTLLVAYTLPTSGENKCIRIQDDEENQRTYLFIWNSDGNHSILYYSYISKALTKIVQDNEYTSSAWTSSLDGVAGEVAVRNSSYYVCLVDYDAGTFLGEKDPEKNSLIWKLTGNYLNFQENNFLDSVIIIRDSQTLLFWTDNHNEPKYINVDKFIGSDYPSVVQPEHLDLCPLQPLYELNVTTNNATVDFNNIAGSFFQFKYRWVFDDDMYGAWSPISRMDIYSQNILSGVDNTENQFSISVFRNSAVASRIKRIDVAVRECRNGNSGDWFKIAGIDASDPADFTTYLSDTSTSIANWGDTGGGTSYETTIELIWNNSGEKTGLDQVETNQLFSYVPKKAGTIAVTEDNRLVFGNVTESIDVSGVDVDMTFSYNYATASIANAETAYLKGLKTGTYYKWGIRYSDSKGRLSAVLTLDDYNKYVKFYNEAGISYPNVSTLVAAINHQPPADAASWQLCYAPNGIDYEGSTPQAYHLIAGLKTKIETMSGGDSHTYVDMQVPRTLLKDNDDSRYPISFSEDYYVRYVANNIGLTPPTYSESKVIGTIDSGEIKSAIVTAGGTYTSNPTVSVVGGGGNGAVFTATVTSGTISSITVNNKGSGYTSFPTLRLSGGGGSGGTVMVTEIDFVKYLKFDFTGASVVNVNDVIEVYKKSSNTEIGLWREFGYPCKTGFDSNGVLAHLGLDTIRDVFNPASPTANQVVGTSALAYSLTECGDIYIGLIKNQYDPTNYPPAEGEARTFVGDKYLELPFADILLDSRSTDLKRPLVAFENDAQLSLNTTLRWSNPLVQSTNINGLGFFYDINFKELKNTYGTIRKIFSENEYLKVFFDMKMALLGMGRNELSSLNGTSLVSAISEVFGTPRYAIPDYGVSDNPESVSTFGGLTIFTDRNKNAVLISNGLDIKVISDAGMKYFFDTVLTEGQGLVNSPTISTSYNKEFDYFLLNINNISEATGTTSGGGATLTITLTEGEVSQLNTSSSINIVSISGETTIRYEAVSGTWSKASSTTIEVTVVDASAYGSTADISNGSQYVLNYSTVTNRWSSFFDYLPDVFGSSGSKLVSSKDGAMYIHNDPTVSTYGEFYDTYYESSITIPFAAEPLKAKNARTLELETSDTNFYLESGTNENGQSTSLLNADFETVEGRQWANILMDENTPLVGGVTNPITEGDLMIGTYFIARIRNTSTALVNMFSTTLRYVKSLI